ncbi:hypothetical protein [Mycobacterium sp. 852002-51057_SCH5723018]|uniref:hypothetical protein n=1 Tax=Mycobacterium sp. 852002-51057_SCH5723018 TaxID=1834094 RepID=UPI0012E98DBD|nr:hypothetical protein [Mycobacterium sp. 852002-51057_SCH5723018]
MDSTNVSFACTRAPEPGTNFKTGQASVDKATGMPLGPARVMAFDASGGDVIGVTVAGEPKVSAGRAVTIAGLGIAYQHAHPDSRCGTGEGRRRRINALPQETAYGEAN